MLHWETASLGDQPVCVGLSRTGLAGLYLDFHRYWDEKPLVRHPDLSGISSVAIRSAQRDSEHLENVDQGQM
jgi:hypothetical protein